MSRRRRNRNGFFHSSQLGVDRTDVGYYIGFPGLSPAQAHKIRMEIEAFLGSEKSRRTAMGHKLTICSLRNLNRHGQRSLQRMWAYFPQQHPVTPITAARESTLFKPDPSWLHFFLVGSQSGIREAGFIEGSRVVRSDRFILSDYHKSFPRRRNGDDGNKWLPINALTPKFHPKLFARRQRKVLRRLCAWLEQMKQGVVNLLTSILPNQKIEEHPFIRRLEVPQDVFFDSPTQGAAPLLFERMAFMGRVLRDNLLSQKNPPLVTGYTRALTEYDFAQNPIKRSLYKHNKEESLELRTDLKYGVNAMTTWVGRHVLPSLYYCTPINYRDDLPEFIAIHAYPRLRIPGNRSCDLFRIEPRFMNRTGKNGQSLYSFVMSFVKRAVKLFPKDREYKLIGTQKPMIVHRLLYPICISLGLSDDEYQTLCKGGGVRVSRRFAFGPYKSVFEKKGKSR